MDHMSFLVQESEAGQDGTESLPYEVLVEHSVSCKIPQLVKTNPKWFVNKTNMSAVGTINFE